MPLQKIVAIVLLVSLMFDAGLQASAADLKLLVRNVALLAGTLVANFAAVPLAALLFVNLLHVNAVVATGILLMAIAPGVPFVLLAGGKGKGGSHELAISLAMLLPVVSTIALPFMTDVFLPGPEKANVPLGQLVGLLAFQFVPLVIGFIVAALAPAVAAGLGRIVRPITMIALIAILVIVSPVVYKSAAVVFGSFGGFAMLLTVVASLAAGWLLAGMPGTKREYRVTLAAGTALRNPAMALAVATSLFATQALVAAAVVTYFLVQALVVAIFGATVLKRRAAA